MIYPIHRDLRKMVHGIGVPNTGFLERIVMRGVRQEMRQDRARLSYDPVLYAGIVLRCTRKQSFSVNRRD